MSKTQPARGMRDFLPADVRRREYVIGVIREVYERYGFEPLETPAVENIETLLGKYGEEGNQLIFKILKRGEHEQTGEADLALRYDLTVPLARVIANNRGTLPKFFKRYQIQPVWRADRPARGRFREFYQCDIDVVGTHSMLVEALLCAAAGEALAELGFQQFTIRLNHRQILAGILNAAGILGDKHASALVALDKLDKLGRNGVYKELTDRGIAEEASNKLLTFFENLSSLESEVRISVDGSIESEREELNKLVLSRLAEFIEEDDEIGNSGIAELRLILKYAKASGAGARIKIDPSLARGLSYYTGAIMEISVPDLSGSLGGGGRYDNLIGMFLKEGIPACGFSLGLERIIVVMTEREMFPRELVEAPAEVMILGWFDSQYEDENRILDSLALANRLRRKKMRVDVYPEPADMDKQFNYARKQGYPIIIQINQEDYREGKCVVKDMRTKTRQEITRAEVESVVLKMFGKESDT